MTDFAKKTGDYGSLSAVDIRVMALTYQLEKENVGTEHIKTVPEKKVGVKVWVKVNRGHGVVVTGKFTSAEVICLILGSPFFWHIQFKTVHINQCEVSMKFAGQYHFMSTSTSISNCAML